MNRFSLLSCLLLGLITKKALSQEDVNFNVSQLQELQTLELCRSDLLEIDENGDMKLDRDEYAGFLQLQTGNEMSGYFQFLPFRMESVYFAAACMCSVVSPNDNQCCLNGNDHVPLNTSQSPLIDPYLDFFCYNVQTGLLAEGFTLSNPNDELPESTSTSPLSDEPSATPSDSPSESPTLGPSDFPSDVPSDSPSDVPSQSPTNSPSRNPTNSPSVKPTEIPSSSPSDFPSSTPTLLPSEYPSLGPSNYPSDFSFPSDVPSLGPSIYPSGFPSKSPSQSPTRIPTTGVPTATPTQAPPAIDPEDTLCVDFQYVVRNQVGLDADAIFNEENNNVLQGLKIATETIIVEILNGTYPPDRRILGVEDEASFPALRNYDNNPSESHASYLRPSRRLKEIDEQHTNRRELAYYTTLLPVAINSITDNPLCAGSAQNPQIVCAIVSSRVCVVVEEADNPAAVRNLMIAGLRQAVDSGDFLRRIPPADLTMTR